MSANRPLGAVDRLLGAVDDHLLGFVLLSVAVGALVPSLSALTALTLPMLAVMVGSVSLTLSPGAFRAVDRRAVGVVLLAQSGMALVAFAVASLLGLGPHLTLGFVVLGAVTPELVTPTMTELAGGDTALSTVVLVAVGLGSLALVPGWVALLVADVPVPAGRVVENLLLAVVGPMLVAVAARARFPDRVSRHDDRYPSVSALMVVLVIGVVTAANAGVVRANAGLLPAVLAGALALNLAGYAGGWLAAAPFDRRTRVAATLSVGMRDFAVAAALVVAAGFPPVASLPAVVFGVVEMATSAALSEWFGE
ncbi:bile acid:sodium symporter family protein [Halorarius halobius]|uniref:bile acid:sodium symporter family protein n=1 Tax=Halorarius halobius TaxID=2962671 RepID=UPI0020CB7D28|nr:bile acid:sodium symporter [Halorarius halobius]